jgi:tetratricopeptide (TPR) repeat protein
MLWERIIWIEKTDRSFVKRARQPMQRHTAAICFALRPTIALSFVLLSVIAAMHARGSLPIIIEHGAGVNKVALKFWQEAETDLMAGNVEAARQNVEAALRSDPTLWPALYTRAKVFLRLGKLQLAVQDCGEALRLHPAFFEAALLRACANAALGKYAESLREIEHVISLHPRTTALARALRDRAWLRAQCPDPSFRNGRQAIKAAKAACSIMAWGDENMIDTLAAACAETGDFDSAIRYEQQALAIKGITAHDSKILQQHLSLFKQHRPLRLS